MRRKRRRKLATTDTASSAPRRSRARSARRDDALAAQHRGLLLDLVLQAHDPVEAAPRAAAGSPRCTRPPAPPCRRPAARCRSGNGPPALEHEPIEITHLGSGIWSYRRRSTGAIFLVTVPATIIRSACRGDARKTSDAEAGDVEPRPAGGHHLDGAAREPEPHRPERVLAGPAQHLVNGGRDDVVVELVVNQSHEWLGPARGPPPPARGGGTDLTRSLANNTLRSSG